MSTKKIFSNEYIQRISYKVAPLRVILFFECGMKTETSMWESPFPRIKAMTLQSMGQHSDHWENLLGLWELFLMPNSTESI